MTSMTIALLNTVIFTRVVALVLPHVPGLAQVGWVRASRLRCCLHFVGGEKGLDLQVERCSSCRRDQGWGGLLSAL